MAASLKDQFGPEIPRNIAGMIAAITPNFPKAAFIRETLEGYAALELMPRAWKIARTLRHYLPQNYTHAAKILVGSLGPKLVKTDSNGMAPFLYLPHAFFVAEYGLEHFEISMHAQYELTQRFTAEFSIRPYLERYQEATLARLKEWAGDKSVHVRRLVSEGTRPRLPWAPRLRAFQANPRPVLALLELLKDDPELYVRRSVANNLNDIGKDHPLLLVKTATKWLQGASEERRWLVHHALRSAVKRAESGALEVLGFGKVAKVYIQKVKIVPKRAVAGESIKIIFDLVNKSSKPQAVLVDFCIHYIKANGKTSPKVFKLKSVTLAAEETLTFKKSISLAEMTTRKHYPGAHLVELILNGRTYPLGSFLLTTGETQTG